MDLQVMKNIQFTRLVKAAVLQREFNFRMIPHSEYSVFHVDVSDERMNRHIFRMHRGQGGWKIVLIDAVPSWVYEAEQQLHSILENETAALLRMDVIPG